MLLIINIVVADVVQVGFSIGLYAKVRNIDNKKAYRELLDRECYSVEKSNVTISPINEIVDIDKRDKIYRKFLGMLKLEPQHRKYLEKQGFLNSTINEQMYKTIPKNYIKRRIIASALSRNYNLEGMPGFYQEEDFRWTFANIKGFFVPVFDNLGRVQALSIHLDKPYNEVTDLWFSSKDKINGTAVKNIILKNNIYEETEKIVLTDNLLLGNLIKDVINAPVIAFSGIVNSYQILKEIEGTNIKNIIFTIRNSKNQNIDYIINRVFKDLIPLGYNLESKYIKDYKDILKEDFLCMNKLEKIA